MTDTHYVYRAYDPDDVLLYVGCTGSPDHRMAAHRCVSMWYPEMSRMEWTGPLPEKDALALESLQIATLSPVYNIAGTPKRYTDGPTIVRLRTERGLERRALARAIGMTSQSLSVLEGNCKRSSSRKTQRRIADALSVPLEDFTIPESELQEVAA